MIRVLLADDHPVVRTGYRRLLEQAHDIVVVHEAADADAAFAALVAHAPEVLVTDLAMPGGGLELIRRARAHDPALRILVFSMHESEAMVQRALEAGATGYLSKASEPGQLVDAVHALHAGRRYLGEGLERALRGRDPLGESARLASLSEREREVFRLLAQGCSPAECASELGLSAKTVSNHQTVIKEKLGVATSAALAHLAIRHGLVSV
ncbi:MAG: response regulator transcription factor [Piscinibacter sp.]|uniref:response regulator n=1 Tax=Piscinibacter sp. TaxID=1903157 RepID=UPI002587CA0D|nr:response regulator transcription factor [Piscinibacter sp.]MCW5664404.1 response regulator transcription factor [Piscinibacter sp.]